MSSLTWISPTARSSARIPPNLRTVAAGLHAGDPTLFVRSDDMGFSWALISDARDWAPQGEAGRITLTRRVRGARPRPTPLLGDGEWLQREDLGDTETAENGIGLLDSLPLFHDLFEKCIIYKVLWVFSFFVGPFPVFLREAAHAPKGYGANPILTIRPRTYGHSSGGESAHKINWPVFHRALAPILERRTGPRTMTAWSRC